MAVYSIDLEKLDEGVKVLVVADPESLEVTAPEIELFDASFKVKLKVLMLEWSINSEKVAEMVETTVVELSAGEVEETVGAVVSIPDLSPATV